MANITFKQEFEGLMRLFESSLPEPLSEGGKTFLYRMFMCGASSGFFKTVGVSNKSQEEADATLTRMQDEITEFKASLMKAMMERAGM